MPSSVAHNKHALTNGKDWPQILAIFTASLISFSSGLHISWPSPAIPKIVNDQEHYDISEAEASYFATLPAIGMILSSYVFSIICQKIGPRKTILLVAVPQISAWILIATAKSIYLFYLARFLTGVGDACLFSSMPMYIGEITTPRVRGAWGSTFTISVQYGVLLINIIGYFLNIRLCAFICMIFPLIHLILFSLMPESPYYLIRKDNMDAAEASLKWFRRNENVEDEFKVLKLDVNRQLSEVGAWKDLFTIRANRRSLLAGVFLRLSQQLSGIHCFVSFTQLIFAKAGTNLPPHISSIIFSALMAASTTSASFFLDRLGRKLCFKLSSYLCGAFLFIQSIYFYIDQFYQEVDIRVVNFLPLLGLIFYCLSFSIGFALVPTLMMGELFSASIKTKALHVLNIVFGLSASLISQIFYLLQVEYGLCGPFLLFAICCILSGLTTDFFVPETKGKTLEEIQQSWKREKKYSSNTT